MYEDGHLESDYEDRNGAEPEIYDYNGNPVDESEWFDEDEDDEYCEECDQSIKDCSENGFSEAK